MVLPEEPLPNSIIQRVEIKKLAHRNSPCPKRQIWQWERDEAHGERTSPVVRSLDAKYTLISEPDMGPLKPYGTALLTREIPSALMHEQYETGDMDRSIMGVELRLGRGGVQTVWVATTHLESAEGNAPASAGGLDNHSVRKEQLEDAFFTLEKEAGGAPVVFMGDMNPTRPEESG
eukprot:1099474-Rhodomonas_salina.2